jgi:hypothetical protein
MTVCVATLFNWNYGGSDSLLLGRAALVMSDRKLTAGNVEYEPTQRKVALVTPMALITVAGEISLHSEAIARTIQQVANKPSLPRSSIGAMYAQAIQAIKRQRAEDRYLAPMGLNTDTFLAQQTEYSDTFVERITSQMQGYIGDDVEALVVASDGTNGHIIHVDSRGTTSNMDDIGFSAIGIGSWHARSKLMQSAYVNSCNFATAITQTFAAKCAAELAPGVGKLTDAHIVFKSG